MHIVISLLFILGYLTFENLSRLYVALNLIIKTIYDQWL